MALDTGQPRRLPEILVQPDPLRGTVRPRDDRAREIPYELRVAGWADIGAVYDLHLAIARQMGDGELYHVFPRQAFEDNARDNGRIIGVFTEDRVIAYGLLSFPGHGPDNMGRAIGLPEPELDLVASLESSGVDPRFQGNGLQARVITFRMQLAAALGYRHRLGYASPKNVHSLVNVFGCKLRARRLMERWPGALRLICHNDADADPNVVRESVRDCPVSDLAQQRALLDLGCWAYDVVKDPTEPLIRFGLFR